MGFKFNPLTGNLDLSGSGGGATDLTDVNSRIAALEDEINVSTRFAEIGAGTAGSITPPANSTIVLDSFGGVVDAAICTIASGKPTDQQAYTAGGTPVTCAFDSAGNYVLSGVPSGYPVALVYRVSHARKDFNPADPDIVWDYSSEVEAVQIRNQAWLKKSVRVMTYGELASGVYSNGTITAPGNGALPDVDGVTLSVGDRLLFTGVLDLHQNGIYVVTDAGSAGSPWVLTRATDADSPDEMQAGIQFVVVEGTNGWGAIMELTSVTPNVSHPLGDMTFEQVSGRFGGGSTFVPMWEPEPFTLTGADIANQYVDLQHSSYGIPDPRVRGLCLEEGVDFTWGDSGTGVTRITFAGEYAAGGSRELVAGDKMVVWYDW